VAAGSGWLLWPAASAGVVAVVEGFREIPLAAAVLIFALLTIVSTLTARRYVPRQLASHAHDINDNVARLIGHEGRVVTPFQAGVGRVFIDGKEWAAELEDGETLDAGARIVVAAVGGARLKVRAA
jgi:membrane protein implicated in regulation of membrane protease activity